MRRSPLACYLLGPAVLFQTQAASADDRQPVEVRRLGLPEEVSEPETKPEAERPAPAPTRVEASPPRPPVPKVDAPSAPEVTTDRLGEAWAAYDAEAFTEAAETFVLAQEQHPVEAAYGTALSYFELGALEDAAGFAVQSIKEGRARQADTGQQEALLAYIRLAQATRALEAGYFVSALDYAARAVDTDETRKDARALIDTIHFKRAEAASERGDHKAALDALSALSEEARAPADIRRLIAWTYFNADDHAESYDRFLALYEETGGEEDANGLYFSAQRIGRTAALRGYLKPGDKRLAALLDREVGEQAFYEKDFLKAYRLNAPQAEALSGIDKPWLSAGFRQRAVDGAAGRGRLSLTSYDISGALSARGYNSFDFTLRGLKASNDLDTDDFDAVVPRVAWRAEGETDFAAEISTTPLGAPASALPLAEAGLRKTEGRNETSATVYARSREESVLSLGGREDEATGQVYGRVVAIGAEADARRSIASNWMLSGSFGGERLVGKNIVENTRLRGEARISRLFMPDKSDYFTAGPFVRVESYDTNTNYFTFGHGGYFSPELFVQSGIGLNYRSPELRRSMVQIDAELAGEHVREGAAFENPLTQSGERFSSRSNSELSGSLKIKYLSLLSEKWMISAQAGVTSSSQFQDARIGVTLRRTFGGRKAVTSRDFEPPSSNQGLWP